MTHCAHCGEYLHADEHWRLRPEIEPDTSELDVPEEYRGDEYMHPDCRKEYIREKLSDPDTVENGERYAKSPLTGHYFLVTEWVDKGGGKIQAREKEQVERAEVPDEWLEVLDDAE